jgi:hypothetical protein
MGKTNESVHRSGTCQTAGCGRPRNSGTWYCDTCIKGFRLEQDQRRGTAGTYPEARKASDPPDQRRATAGRYVHGKGRTETELLGSQSDGADCVIKIEQGIVLDPALRLKNGVILNGEYAGSAWKDVRGEILSRAAYEDTTDQWRGKQCMVEGCTRIPNPGYSLCPDHYQKGLSTKLRERKEFPLGKPANLCIVEGCTKKAPSGYKTCNDHAKFEPVSTAKSGAVSFNNGWTSKPACDNGAQGHDGTKPVATVSGGRTLYGAKGSNLTAKTMDHLDLIIDCAGVVSEAGKFVKSAPAKYRRLNRGLMPDIIRLDWPDMSAPVHVGIRFWRSLLEMLPARTCACCVGGHGRTGTCLAALLIAGGMDGEAAIHWIRQHHCSRAIETAGQEAYLKALAKARDELDAQAGATVTESEPEPVKGGV